MTKLTFYKIMMTVVAALAVITWPYVSTHTAEIKQALIELVRFSHQHNVIGYLLFAVIFSIVLFLGLPFATLIMLLSGILYNFWEASVLVTICRLNVAVLCFILADRIAQDSEPEKPKKMIRRRKRTMRQQTLLEKIQARMQDRQKLTLFLLRLSPLPDNVVNFSVNASSLRLHNYITISLIGMIPFTLFYIWMGDKLGSISKLMHYFFN